MASSLLYQFHSQPIFPVALSTGLTEALSRPKRERLCALADPSLHPSRISVDQGVIRDVVGDDRPRSDEPILPDGVTADEGDIGPDRRAPPYQSRTKLFLSRDEAPRIEDIGKDHGWTAEHIILQNDRVIDGNIILNLDTISEDGSRADEDILTNEAVVSDLSTGHHMGEVPNLSARANIHRIVNHCRGMDEITLLHASTSRDLDRDASMLQ